MQNELLLGDERPANRFTSIHSRLKKPSHKPMTVDAALKETLDEIAGAFADVEKLTAKLSK